MRYSRPCLALLAPVALLAGCGAKDGGAGADISVTGDDGNVVAAANGKTGKVSFNLPGVSADIRLPKIQLDAEDMDIDGVKLYPGSTINAMNVKTGVAGDHDDVEIRFAAPAAPNAVRDYFLNAFRNNGGKVVAQGEGLSGVGKDGDPVRIDIEPRAGGGAQGRIALSSRD